MRTVHGGNRWHSVTGMFWGLLRLGDVFGKITALVAFPSAAVTVFVFWQEIGDFISAPDIGAGLSTVELRCGVELDTQEEIDRAEEDFDSFCAEAPVAVTLEVALHNRDRIARTIQDLSARVHFPDGYFERDVLSLMLVRRVEHRVANHVTQATLVPWRPARLLEGEARTIELEFWPLKREERLAFRNVQDALTRDALPLRGKMARIELLAEFPGERGRLRLAECRMQFEQDSMLRFAAQPANEQVAYVRRCESPGI